MPEREAGGAPGSEGVPERDLVVYGATAGGVVAAVAAARAGLRVTLLAADAHIGGMVTGGLGKTDMERQEHVIGGLARAFFREVGAHYGEPVAFRFEPSVARSVFDRWLRGAAVDVRVRVGLPTAVMDGPAIRSVVGEDGERYAAPVFIDASYEGDLIAAAGVPYRVGRESRSLHGETLAGRRELLPGPHQFCVPVPAVRHDGSLLPYVRPYTDLVPVGDGDGLMQAYCYRLCLTDRPADRLPLPAPDGDPARFDLVRAHARALGDRATLRDFLGIGRLPGGKTDVNSDGPVSTNLLGANGDHVEADTLRRRAIAEEHRSWALGLLHVLASDPAVPERVRAEAGRFGLPADEFPESGHVPPQLYVREARRILGEHVMTERDVRSDRTKADVIGMGGYNIDIREVQWVAVEVSRFPDVFPETLTEGYLSVPVEPYAIPYRALLPRREHCSNLLVSGCVSSSHVAYATLRLEPQFMIMGHAAGLAAAEAVRSRVPPHDVDVPALQQRLVEQGQILRP